MTESKFEQSWSEKAKKKGWYSVKIIQASKNGMPDRMYLKNGMIFFVEFKAKKGKLSKLQEYRISELRRMNFHVLIIAEK
ncbi:MAG: VRR-NUC domain-containing protein [Bacteroidales bacterium]|jgi:Holliday junction resolvase|nr:VRR-NUC domain-containing protein [Bacteroidales bacterium]